MNSSSGTANIDTTADQVSTLIHGQGKVRYGTACYPCKQRKVKCDNTLPCKNCQKRDYPNLCSYVPKTGGNEHDRPVKRQRMITPVSDTNGGRSVSMAAENRRVDPSVVENARTHFSRGSEDGSSEKTPRTNGRRDCESLAMKTQEGADHEVSGDDTPTPRYLGENSIPAFFGNQNSPEGRLGAEKQGVLGTEILPMLGLQNPAGPYPFMSSNQIEQTRQEVFEALPPNREILRYVAC